MEDRTYFDQYKGRIIERRPEPKKELSIEEKLKKGARTAKIIKWGMIPVFVVGFIVSMLIAEYGKMGGFWYVICPFMPVIFMGFYAIFVKLFTVPLD